MKHIEGFSKLSKDQKINVISSLLENSNVADFEQVKSFWHPDEEIQKSFEEFSENTLSNFYLPYGVAPNFLINDKTYMVPMVIEESSVVAAASKAAKFWFTRGGFKTRILGTTKVGQVHFLWEGDKKKLSNFFNLYRTKLLNSIHDLCINMEKRGGGLLDLKLVDRTEHLENYFQLKVTFETCDAMGANFINSVLERLAQNLRKFIEGYDAFNGHEKHVEIVMSILSNYTPNCTVHASVSCPIEDLEGIAPGMSAEQFAHRFEKACQISKVDVSRAVTHNKGIFNGIDAVILATGNDFRAIEACGHAFAAKDGLYRGLSSCSLEDDIFNFEITIPLALGTVGGLTSLHPLAKASLSLLGKPSAKELMQVAAAVGLAQNFSALRSLVSTGIQRGHMKMHLLNILKQLGANEEEISEAKVYFEDRIVSYAAVRTFLQGHNTLQ